MPRCRRKKLRAVGRATRVGIDPIDCLIGNDICQFPSDVSVRLENSIDYREGHRPLLIGVADHDLVAVLLVDDQEIALEVGGGDVGYTVVVQQLESPLCDSRGPDYLDLIGDEALRAIGHADF